MSDITANRYIILGTGAERALFTPDPTDISSIGPGQFLLVIWVESDTGDMYYWDATAGVPAWVLLNATGSGITQLTGDVTAGPGSGSQAATIANDAVTTAKILNAAVTLAKIANAAANSRLLGSGSGGSGSAYSELTVGAGLTIGVSSLALNTAAKTRAISFVIDGGGSALTTGTKIHFLYIPYDCTITAVTLGADQSGSVALDIKKCAFGVFPGSLASIVAAAPPTLSAAQTSQDTTLTGWTLSVSAGDVLQISVSSASTLTWLQGVLTVVLS